MTKSEFDFTLKQSSYRWLQGIDFRQDSKTYGSADREYWAWKTKDFANGTLQAGLAGFLDCSSLLNFSEKQIASVVSCVVQGSRAVQRSNGSFEEAYPGESSYAVTGLVLFNLMYARHKYALYFSAETNQTLTAVVTSCVKFLNNTPETHGVISNHLATTELALNLAQMWLRQPLSDCHFFSHQHAEGWFLEYDGADPGYQTLLEHYIAAAVSAGWSPRHYSEKIQSSRHFTRHFTLPNGSFAGEIGARGTGIFYPSCLLLDPNPEDLSWFINVNSSFASAVQPLTVDPGNFVPVFNSWALFWKENPSKSQPVPSYVPQENRMSFPAAGLYVGSTSQQKWILSTKYCNWRLQRKIEQTWSDQSVAALQCESQILSEATIDTSQSDVFTLKAQLKWPSPQRLNSPASAIALRLLSLCLFLVPQLQRGLKKLLARYVMAPPQGENPKRLELRIHLQPSFSCQLPEGLQARPFGFRKHMASANAFEERAL